MADIEMKNISISFGDTHALVKANFSADKGDVMGLLGENGAGKSTLIKVLCGINREDEGEVFLFGKKIHRRNTREAMREGIRVVHQELSLIPYATVAENIFMSEEESPLSRRTLDGLSKKALALFDRLGIDDVDPDAYVSDISLAKRQKVEITKALAQNAEVVVFDESTSALTEKDVEWLFSLIGKLAGEGKIIIFISHRMQEVNRVCNKYTIMRNGSDVGCFKMGEINADEMVTLMLGHKIAGYYPEDTGRERGEVRLHVEDLRHGHTLNGISFDLHAGEILGIGGLSGQGQSELFNALFGAIQSTGVIEINGKPTKIHHTSTALKHGVALVPEDRGKEGLVLAMSVKDNMTISSLKKICSGPFLSSKKETEQVNEMMKAIQIKAASKEIPVGTLSGGNQQKVVFAKELMQEPDILLLYDITRGVDVGTKKEMFELMYEQCRQGKAILFYSTDTEELVHMCDSIYIMFDGMFRGHLKKEEMTGENIVRISVGADE